MHGEETLDDLIFHLLSAKSQVIADALDGKVSEYRIAHAEYEEIKDDVKDRKEKGTLNPAVKADGVKTKKAKIDDFFARQKDLNNFVKKRSKSLEDSREEEIEASEFEEEALVLTNKDDHSHEKTDSPEEETEKIVEMLKKNPKKRKASKELEKTKGGKKRKIAREDEESEEEEDKDDDEFIL